MVNGYKTRSNNGLLLDEEMNKLFTNMDLVIIRLMLISVINWRID